MPAAAARAAKLRRRDPGTVSTLFRRRSRGCSHPPHQRLDKEAKQDIQASKVVMEKKTDLTEEEENEVITKIKKYIGTNSSTCKTFRSGYGG